VKFRNFCVLAALLTLGAASCAGLSRAGDYYPRSRSCYQTYGGYYPPVVSYGYQQAPYYETKVRTEYSYVEPSYYYTVGDAYRDGLLADAIAYRVLVGQRQGAVTATSPVPRLPPITRRPRNLNPSRRRASRRGLRRKFLATSTSGPRPSSTRPA
jgi:hypothetical protein